MSDKPMARRSTSPPPEHSSPDGQLTRWVTAVLALAAAGTVIYIAQPVFNGQLPTGSDLLHFHLPIRHHYAQCLAVGQAFEWMPSVFSGYYIGGEGQMGPYHPLHWLMYRWLPLQSAFSLELVLHYPFMLAGAWLFLRRWCPDAAALFGAMLLTFCGFMMSHSVHINMVAVVAHLPWLLWGIQQVGLAETRGARWRALAAISLLTGSQLLLGFPQGVWFSLQPEILFVLFLWFTRHLTWRGAAAIALAKLLGVMIGAVQLLATLDVAASSVRVVADAEFANSYSLPAWYLLQLVGPTLLWGRVLDWSTTTGDEYAAYGGAVPLLLLVWLLASLWRSREGNQPNRRLALAAAAFGLYGLWMALGLEAGLYYWQVSLPVVSRFRCPARYVLYFQLALAIVSALSLSRLLRRSPESEQPGRGELLAIWSLPVASLAATAFLLAKFGDQVDLADQLPSLLLGPTVFVAGAAALTATLRGARWGLVALVFLAVADQSLYGLGGVAAWREYAPYDLTLRRIVQMKLVPEKTAGRLVRGQATDVPVLLGYRLYDGYVGIIPLTWLQPLSLPGMRVAGVEYVHADYQAMVQIPELKSADGIWYRVPDVLPRFRLVTNSQISRDPLVDIRSIDVAQTALAMRELSLATGAPGSVETLHDRPGDILLHAVVPSRQLLVVSERFHDDWLATVDDQLVPLERLYGDYFGCVLEPGDHEVHFQFQPAHLPLGRALSLLGLAITILLGASPTLLAMRHRSQS